jgi:hypothetical protein
LNDRTRTAARLARASIVVAVSALYFACVFRLPDDTLLRSGLGDWVDPYFINFLLEHWHHSIWSLADATSPPMYFPVRGTLGYSHGLILYVPFYMAVRPFLHPFQAYNLTLFLVLETGALCLYLIFRKFVGLGFVESLLLSAFFFSSPNVINGGTGVWSQRASVFLIPPVLLAALVSAGMARGRLRLALGGLAGLALSLLFSQDFYTAGFVVLVSTLFLAGALPIAGAPLADDGRLPPSPSPWWLIVAGLSLMWALAVQLHPISKAAIGPLTFSATNPTRALFAAILTCGWFVYRRSGLTGRFISWWKRDRPYIQALGMGAFIGCLVFLRIYLGAYREHPALPGDQLINALTTLDVSRFDFGRALGTYDSLRPFTLVLVVAILASVPWFQVEKKTRLQCLWFLFVSLIVLAIPLSVNNLSIWTLFFAKLPGFSLIRDPRRVIEFYELAATLLAALFLARLPRRSPLRISFVVVVFLLLATNWNRNEFDFDRPTSVYARWVEAPIDIDASCKSFFVKRASDAYMSRSFHKWSLYAVDSMFIALNASIPTLNGYSAWWPDGWGLANPQEPGYTEAAARWIEGHHLRDVCELDIEARTMRPYAPASR